ncbi:BRISC complex subunit Abro1 [Rhynchospora pubera]|uniref:BRISC complex subunit Abro1 n=1 Tax=Rhynchospora pubera TaxID=906938 RepID=A0AAV8DVZ0_9POAL|nr:BRISC complex subunit Abro1 [Rhynchospora pubera]
MATPPPPSDLSISGAALASLLHLAATSASDSSGLLSGHLSLPSSSSAPLSDFDPSPSIPTPSPSSHLFITHLFSFNSPLSFFSSLGHVDAPFLRSHFPDSSSLVGWFSFRRNSALRPSMRELAVSVSLSKTLGTDTPCVFLLLSSSLSPNRAVHTHDYRAFLLRPGAKPVLEPMSLRVLNVGPGSSGGQYSAFSANLSTLPSMPCAIRGMDDVDSMVICEGGKGNSKKEESLLAMKEKAREQKVLDSSTEGFEVERLERLVGVPTNAYTHEIEELYRSMLSKLESLTHQVEKTSAMVFEQENQNLELRCKVAGME